MFTPEADYGEAQSGSAPPRQPSGWHHESEQGAVSTQESPFVLVFNEVSDLLFLIRVEAGPQFRCLRVNHAYVTKTGWTQEQVEGKLIEEILPPEHARFVIEKYTTAIQTRCSLTYEVQAEVPIGQLIVETTLTPVFDQQGNCTHLLGDSRDITERTRIAKALQESEERYRNLFENANDALATFTLDGTITAVNRAAERLIGWSQAELIGRDVSEFATPASVALAEERAQHFLSGKRLPSSIFEAELVHKDGSSVMVEARTNAIRNAAGEPIGFQGIYRDITERKRAAAALQQAHAELERRVQERTAELQQANETLRAEIAERKRVEAALRAAKEDYRALFENAVEGIYRSSLDGKQLRANPALVKLNGYSSEEEQIAAVNDIATEWYVDPHRREEFARILETEGLVTDFESEIYRHKTRERIWISETARLVRNSDGHPLYYEGTVQDISTRKQAEETLRALNANLELRIAERTTELMQTNDVLRREIDRRKRIEEDLRESEQRYRAVVETQTELICRFRPDTTLTFVNEAYCRYFGKSREELLGTSFLSLVPEQAQLAVKAHIDSLIANPRFVVNEHEVIADGGESRWQQWTNQAIVDETGRLTEFQSTGLDITERKQAEETLQQLQAELAQVSRTISMGEMAASIAHEVNQPLGAIVGNADICLRWLADEAPDLEQVREALSDIIKDGYRASEVISRIRTLVKRRGLQKTGFNINEIVHEAIRLASHEVPRKFVRLRTDLATDLPPLFGDRVQLGQVMLNLIMNGIEAMVGVEGRTRDLLLRSCRDEVDGVRITVQDCGVGIDPQEAKQMFAPFYTTKPGGMGMGLAICRSIVEAHGGRLWAAPNVGSGATFQFTLPCNSEEVR